MHVGCGANVLQYLSAACIARFLIILPECQLYQIIMPSLVHMPVFYVTSFVSGHDDLPAWRIGLVGDITKLPRHGTIGRHPGHELTRFTAQSQARVNHMYCALF